MKRGLLAAVLFLLSAAPAFAAKGDTVVLLHGIGRTSGSMQKMAGDLSRKGYAVINIDYASRKKPVEDLAEDIGREIRKHPVPTGRKIHFIGHSMGGLVIRAYIHRHRPANLGRVVLLGTPNQGSEVADLLHGTALFNSFYGPAGEELVTDQKKFAKLYGDVNYGLGVIAGDRSIDPVSSLLIIPGDDDGKVSVERTKIRGMKDHIVLHATHTFMPSNDDVIRQSEYFLENGKFLRAETAPVRPRASF